MKTFIKGHFFTLWNDVSASFLDILTALERHFNQVFTRQVSLRRDAPFPSITLNLHKQIIFAVLAEYDYERVQTGYKTSCVSVVNFVNWAWVEPSEALGSLLSPLLDELKIMKVGCLKVVVQETAISERLGYMFLCSVRWELCVRMEVT